MHTEVVSIFGDERRLCLTLSYLLTEITDSDKDKVIDNQKIQQLWMMTMHFLDRSNGQLPKKFKGKKLTLLLLLRFLGNYLRSPTKLSNSLKNNLRFYCRDLLLDKYQYYGFSNSWVKDIGLSSITIKILPKRRFAPAPYIGVGYRDKGSANNSAVSGISFNTYMKSDQLKELDESFYKQDFNSSFDIIETCSQVDDDIEDVLMDY